LLIDAVAYQHILKEQEEKDNKMAAMEKQFNEMQSQMKSLLSIFSNIKEQTQIDNMANTLVGSGYYVAKKAREKDQHQQEEQVN
jgi:hypothetical protein